MKNLEQVSLPHYADPEFHTDSLRRYKVSMRIVMTMSKTKMKMEMVEVLFELQ